MSILSKPMLHEQIAQLERSLLNEIATHDKAKRRLKAQEQEIERMRDNLYKDRVVEACDSDIGLLDRLRALVHEQDSLTGYYKPVNKNEPTQDRFPPEKEGIT